MYEVPVLDKNNRPHYLAQRLMDVEEGDELILEMVSKGGRSYISVTKVGAEGQAINLDEEHPGGDDESHAAGFEELAGSL